MFHRGEIRQATVRSLQALVEAEDKYRRFPEGEIIAYAKNTPYRELCELVLPDSDGKNLSEHPVQIIVTEHSTTVGLDDLSRKTYQFLEEYSRSHDGCIDILSVQAGIDGEKLTSIYMIRLYDEKVYPDPKDLFLYLGEIDREDALRPLKKPEKKEHEVRSGKENALYNEWSKRQETVLSADGGVPYLNSLSEYVPIYKKENRENAVYHMRTDFTGGSLRCQKKEFDRLFKRSIAYFTSQEKNSYIEVMYNDSQSLRESFALKIDRYIRKNFVEPGQLPIEDTGILKHRIENALFDLYVIQDLITDNPEITDIKITAPDAVRVRIRGKAYLSDVSFIDREDYLRFVDGLAVRNRIDLSVPMQTFTDVRDKDYILRFTVTAGFVTSTGLPGIHIRKISRKKKTSEDLIREGLLTPVLRDYMIDCGRFSRGIVIAGPPGSGKTTLLNWLLDDGYEDSSEILCIQENDELFSEKKGILFEHVILNPKPGEKAVSLEELGQLALVSGCNVFVIGEAKGAEICSAITLSNSGCRSALTIHSPSANETIDKMADLALRGYAESFEQAKRMIRSFQTIVYVEDYRIREISEIVGFDEKKKDVVYRTIYKNPA